MAQASGCRHTPAWQNSNGAPSLHYNTLRSWSHTALPSGMPSIGRASSSFTSINRAPSLPQNPPSNNPPSNKRPAPPAKTLMITLNLSLTLRILLRARVGPHDQLALNLVAGASFGIQPARQVARARMAPAAARDQRHAVALARGVRLLAALHSALHAVTGVCMGGLDVWACLRS